LALCTTILAFGLEEPGDFQGITWGANIDTISGMKKVSTQEHIDIYIKEHDLLEIGGVNVKTIEYYFLKGKFMGSYIAFEGFPRFTAIKKYMVKTYGPGEKRNYFLDNIKWLTKNLLITLNYAPRTNSGFILYCYLPLWDEKTG